MSILSTESRFADGRIFCAFQRSPSSGHPLILTIPGGPCLSGDYLRPFLGQLSERTGMNVGLLDLPNHGRSSGAGDAPLTYPACLELLKSATREISAKCGELFLFGQSFGARLALDLTATMDSGLRGAILTGLPCRFHISKALEKRLSTLGLEDYTGTDSDEAVFARNWRKILPFYTAKPLPAADFEGLAAGTKWSGNERMADGVPALEGVASALMRRSAATRLLIIQGASDQVIPDGNADTLRRILPTAATHVIPDAGHFVMVEQAEATLSVMADFLRRAATPRA